MSVSLHCPNCGGNVGEAESSTNYQPVYYKADKNGQPECPHCGAGESMVNFEKNMFIGAIMIVVAIISLTIIFS